MMARAEVVRLFSTADQDPYPYLDESRRRGSVLWDDELNGWAVLTYDLCRQVLMDEATFAHNYINADAGTLEIKGGRSLVVAQGAEHDQLHRLAMQMFSPGNIVLFRERHVRPVVAAQIDAFAGRGRAELRAELCNPVPGCTTLSLMGIDWSEPAVVQHVVELHEVIMECLGKMPLMATELEIRRAKDASRQLNEILMPVIRERRGGERDDLLSKLWAGAPKVLDAYDEHLILANAREFFLGGFDTTVHALSNGIYLLLTQPELRAAVDADRDTAMNAFIEEVLRTQGVLQHRRRVAVRDVDLGGVAIRAGDRVFPVLHAANRDPAKFGPRPGQVDLTRERPREHLTFIVGPRTCPGASLARAEMRVVFQALLDRLPKARLDPGAEPPRFRGGFTRSYWPLHVLFEPLALAKDMAEQQGKRQET